MLAINPQPAMNCVFVGDDGPCQRTRHVQKSGRVRTLCPLHFAKYNRDIASKNYLKNTRDLSDLELTAFKKRRTEESVIRTQKSIILRQMVLHSIADSEIQRIATIFDRIKKKEAYVIVPNAIRPLTIKDIKTKGCAKPITFQATMPYKRTMQAVSNANDYLSSVIAALRIVFPKCDKLLVKLLKSAAGDTAQELHTDFTPGQTTQPMKDLTAFHYSALISFEKNTRLLCDMDKKEIDIPLYSMILFRGDFRHAGAAYSKMNRRLFISLSSESFPETDDVFIHKFY
jgi:hypothetical protein